MDLLEKQNCSKDAKSRRSTGPVRPSELRKIEAGYWVGYTRLTMAVTLVKLAGAGSWPPASLIRLPRRKTAVYGPGHVVRPPNRGPQSTHEGAECRPPLNGKLRPPARLQTTKDAVLRGEQPPPPNMIDTRCMAALGLASKIGRA